MQIETILADVRKILDENEDDSVLITEVDEVANDTDTITQAMILQSIDKVHQIAPLWMVTDVMVQETIDIETHRKGKAGNVQGNFLRFAWAEAQDWTRRVYLPIDQDSDEYAMQSSRFAGIRGSKEKPVVAIVPGSMNGSDGLIVEVWSTDEDTLTMAYVAKAAESQGTVNIAEKCYRAVLYMIAKYYTTSIGDKSRATAYGNVAAELLGIASSSD